MKGEPVMSNRTRAPEPRARAQSRRSMAQSMASANLMDSLQPGAPVVIAMDTAGAIWLAPTSADLSATLDKGAIRVEVRGLCLGRVTEPDPGWPTRRLRRILKAQQLLRVAHKLAGAVTVATMDARGRLYLREQPFGAAQQAQAWLNNRRGDWILMQMDERCLRIEPPLSALNAFSASHPIPGSLVVARGGQVVGPFVDPGDLLVEWIFSHFPSGYYAVVLLERCALFDQGPCPFSDDPARGVDSNTSPGDYHVFTKGPDGRTSLAMITPDRAAAEAFIAARAGRWLLARCMQMLDLR